MFLNTNIILMLHTASGYSQAMTFLWRNWTSFIPYTCCDFSIMHPVLPLFCLPVRHYLLCKIGQGLLDMTAIIFASRALSMPD